MIRRRHSIIYWIAKIAERIAVICGIIGLAFIGWVLFTAPEPYIDAVTPTPAACIVYDSIDTEITFDDSAFTPWSELFPEGNEYGKDGEILQSEPEIFALFDHGIDLFSLPSPSFGSGPEIQSVTRPQAVYRRYATPWLPYGGGISKEYSNPNSARPKPTPDLSACASKIPEPKSWHLIIIGLLSLAVWRWVGR